MGPIVRVLFLTYIIDWLAIIDYLYRFFNVPTTSGTYLNELELEVDDDEVFFCDFSSISKIDCRIFFHVKAKKGFLIFLELCTIIV